MSLLADFQNEFRRYKTMADNAIVNLDEEAFFLRPG